MSIHAADHPKDPLQDLMQITGPTLDKKREDLKHIEELKKSSAFQNYFLPRLRQWVDGLEKQILDSDRNDDEFFKDYLIMRSIRKEIMQIIVTPQTDEIYIRRSLDESEKKIVREAR